MGQKLVSPDFKIARIAERQHGVISVAQLARAGVSPNAASKRARTGRLHRIHQGVYAVGHRAPTWRGRWTAAILACGEGAVLSHLSAAYLWRLLKPQHTPVDVSVSSPAGRARRKGIRIHRRPTLGPDAITERHGIPVTTPAQTIADLRGMASEPQLRRAIRQAEVRGLRTGLGEDGERTRSELEDLFMGLCQANGLPRPEVNVRVGRHEVDFLWRRQRLVVETDGYRYHRGQQAFEDDHERDLALRDLGYDLRRFSYRQVTEKPTQVTAAISAALRPSPTPRP